MYKDHSNGYKYKWPTHLQKPPSYLREVCSIYFVLSHFILIVEVSDNLPRFDTFNDTYYKTVEGHIIM